MGRNAERNRLNVVRRGREERSVLAMNPGFVVKLGRGENEGVQMSTVVILTQH